MVRRSILIIIIFSISFTSFKDKTPRLSKLTITTDRDQCTGPNAVILQKYTDNNFVLSFGYNDYFKKQDTINFLYKNDTLNIKIIVREKPRIIFKNGIQDTVPGLREDPDCECFTLFELEIRNLPQKPKHILVNKYIHDDEIGFVTIDNRERYRASAQRIKNKLNFSLDTPFVLNLGSNVYPDLTDIGSYLRYRGSLNLTILDADTKFEKELFKRTQNFLMKKIDICPTRISENIDNNLMDQDSTSITVKISDTKSFLFPEYNWKKK
jgi:hypothetical protein